MDPIIMMNNNDDKCFQYAITNALNHKNIAKETQRISKSEPFLDNYNQKKVSFPPHKKIDKSLNQLFNQ